MKPDDQMDNKCETYHMVLLEIPPALQDEIEKVKKMAEEFSCEGIEEFSLEERLVDEILGEKSYSGGELPMEDILYVEKNWRKETTPILMKFYFYGEKSGTFAEDFEREIRRRLPNIKVKIEEKKFEDWNMEWKRHFKSIRISDLLEVVPSWEQNEGTHFSTSKFPIYIYPGMAFGTGNHATTFLCLGLLSELFTNFIENDFLKEGICLDFGCGSGILGISAAKLGFNAIDFIDIDRNALDNCLENIRLNFKHDYEERNFYLGNKEEKIKGNRHYDLIFANILENVLLEKRDMLGQMLSSGGYLILSGILREQADNVEKEYSRIPFLELVKREYKDDWCALLFKRSN